MEVSLNKRMSDLRLKTWRWRERGRLDTFRRHEHLRLQCLSFFTCSGQGLQCFSRCHPRSLTWEVDRLLEEP